MRIAIARFTSSGVLLLAMCMQTACQPGGEGGLFADGAMKSKAERRANAEGAPIQNGWFRSRHANGRVHEQGLYVNGKMHGEWTVWDEHGRMRGRQQYLDGLREGQWTAWHKNGRIARRWQYANDQPHGVWLTWDENGVLIERELYERGEKRPM